MRASVILSYLNSEKTLPECLRRLKGQTLNEEYEIVAIDGAKYGKCSEVAGQNIAIEQAKGDVLFFTNSDIFVNSDWLFRHLRHYPRVDMVLGASPHLPMYGPLSLSFTNFSCKRWVLDRFPINETLHQDLDFSARVFKSKKAKWLIDNSIKVTTDDNDIKGQKAFRYLMNIVILYRKYRILPVPPVVPLSALKSAIDRPEKIFGILTGLLAPVNQPIGKRVKHK